MSHRGRALTLAIMRLWTDGLITDVWTGTSLVNALAWWRRRPRARDGRFWIEDRALPAVRRRAYTPPDEYQLKFNWEKP